MIFNACGSSSLSQIPRGSAIRVGWNHFGSYVSSAFFTCAFLFSFYSRISSLLFTVLRNERGWNRTVNVWKMRTRLPQTWKYGEKYEDLKENALESIKMGRGWRQTAQIEGCIITNYSLLIEMDEIFSWSRTTIAWHCAKNSSAPLSVSGHGKATLRTMRSRSKS